MVTSDGFFRALALLVHASGRTMSDPVVVATAAKLFDLLDRDGNGTLDFHELATGLTVFCAGSTDAKVRAAFDLYGTSSRKHLHVAVVEWLWLSGREVIRDCRAGLRVWRWSSGGVCAHSTVLSVHPDIDGNGFIDVSEMERYLKSVFRIMVRQS